MRFKTLSLLSLFFLATSSAFALDPACEVVLKAAEARIQQPAWHSITQIGEMRMEVIKVDGKFYRRMGEKWVKSSVNIDDAEREFIAQARNGEWKITECKTVGTDTVNGMSVTVVSSRTEMKDMAPADAKLYIGKSDGLPYRQTGKDTAVEYHYKDIVAPKS